MQSTSDEKTRRNFRIFAIRATQPPHPAKKYTLVGYRTRVCSLNSVKYQPLPYLYRHGLCKNDFKEIAGENTQIGFCCLFVEVLRFVRKHVSSPPRWGKLGLPK